MLYYKNQKIISEKVSIVLFEKMLITFQEVPGDIFDGIRNALRNNKGKLRKLGVDFLVYSLINAVVDNYMIILEKMAEQIDNLEEIVMDTTNRDIIKSIHIIKNNVIYLRKAIWPLREVLYQIDRGQSGFINDEITIYFRDINYHLIHIFDQIEIYRETLTGMTDIFLSNMDHKLNNVMRRLTIITTIFMPLTVLTGIGGMSEWSMITGQENWMFSYPLFFLIMGVIGVGTYLFLRFKKWI